MLLVQTWFKHLRMNFWQVRASALAWHTTVHQHTPVHWCVLMRGLSRTARPHRSHQGAGLSGDGEAPRVAIAFTGVLREGERVSLSDARHGARQGAFVRWCVLLHGGVQRRRTGECSLNVH